ncbi:Nickel uptake substrate-specific transmembrane region [Planctomycetes bacterium Poly30]|uniref:Nickel uptake substrate-specific transmembrane region n=1 Tax=Saltatorellus ferox TaxID=2528018 RepID=A0A518ER70_9BACT|nr:Nickel uptake substrate-specific transmembrane region [Planctomycetes bacterium Poly30]
MKPTLALLGAAALVIGCGAFFFLASSDEASSGSGTAGLTLSMGDSSEAGDPSGEMDPDVPALKGAESASVRTEAEIAALPPSTDAAASAAADRNVDPATARRVIVEIAWPAGTPSLEAEQGERRLIAWSDEAIDAENFDWQDPAMQRRMRRRSSGQAALLSIGRRASEDEVRFDVVTLEGGVSRVEVLFDGSAVEGRLQLASRYLYLPEAPTLQLASAPAVVRLEPEVGAWVTGRVAPDAAKVQADADGQYGTVSLRGGTLGGGPGRRMNFTDREVPLGEDLTFDFHGVNPGLVLRVTADVPGNAPMTSDALELNPGARTFCSIRVRRGSALSGRVLDPSGDPIAGALVSAGKNGGMFGRGGARREATSDAKGRFLITGLEAGSYSPTAALEGWRSGRVEEAIELAEDVTLSDVLIRLDPGLEIVGRVLMPDGAPAGGARLRLTQPEPGSDDRGGMPWGQRRERSERKEAVADSLGTFRFTALARTPARIAASMVPDVEGGALLAASAEKLQPAPPGSSKPVELRLAPTVTIRGRVLDDRGEAVTEFDVRAAREGFTSRSGAGDGVRGSFAAREDGTFELEGAAVGTWQVSIAAEGLESPEDQTLTVQLPQEGPPLEFTLTRLGAVRGVVVDPSGAPVAGAEVRRDAGGFGFGGRGGPGGGGGSVKSAKDGTFELAALSPGSQVLVANSDDWAPSEPTTFEVVPGADTLGAVLTLRLGGTIVGVVRDDAGNPWPGRRVTYASGGGPIAMFGAESATDTDARGAFRFDHVAPGKWVVNAAPGEAEMMETMQSGDRQSAFFDLLSKNLSADVVVEDGQEVRVDLGAEARDPVTVFGTVTVRGDAVREGNVTLAREGADLFANLKRADIGQDGTYRIELDRPGAYIFAVERGSGRNQFFVDIASGEEQRVDLELPEGGVAGRVRDSEGNAVAGVRVSVEGQSSLSFARFNPRGAITDENGGYEILELDPGTYTLRFGSETFGPRARGGNDSAAGLGRVVVDDVVVTRSEVKAGLNVELPGAGRITGIVRDLQGDPVPGATIFVRDRSGRPVDSISTTTTGASGRFTYSRLSPGTYSVSAQTDTAAAPDVSGVIVKESEDAEVELELSDASMLVVTTVDDDQEPVRAQLSVRDSDGREMTGLVGLRSFRSMGTGLSTTEQKIGPLTPGRYTVTATAQDGRTATKKVTVRDRDETSVRVKFKD